MSLKGKGNYRDEEKDHGRRTSGSTERRKRRSRSSSVASASTSNSDESEVSHAKHRDKQKKRKRSRSRSRSRSRDELHEKDGDRHRYSKNDKKRKSRKEEKREKRKRREDKRAKRAAKKAKKGGAIQEYGKHGVLNETDMYTKDSEFRAWIIEERTLNPEIVSNIKMKELFKTFAEDWNTVTLPEKYYNLEAHERRMRSIANGETIAPEDTSYDFRKDEADIKNRQRAEPRQTRPQDELTYETLVELRKVARERIEGSQMKRLGLQTKESLGVRYE